MTILPHSQRNQLFFVWQTLYLTTHPCIFESKICLLPVFLLSSTKSQSRCTPLPSTLSISYSVLYILQYENFTFLDAKHFQSSDKSLWVILHLHPLSNCMLYDCAQSRGISFLHKLQIEYIEGWLNQGHQYLTTLHSCNWNPTWPHSSRAFATSAIALCAFTLIVLLCTEHYRLLLTLLSTQNHIFSRERMKQRRVFVALCLCHWWYFSHRCKSYFFPPAGLLVGINPLQALTFGENKSVPCKFAFDIKHRNKRQCSSFLIDMAACISGGKYSPYEQVNNCVEVCVELFVLVNCYSMMARTGSLLSFTWKSVLSLSGSLWVQKLSQEHWEQDEGTSWIGCRSIIGHCANTFTPRGKLA